MMCVLSEYVGEYRTKKRRGKAGEEEEVKSALEQARLVWTSAHTVTRGVLLHGRLPHSHADVDVMLYNYNIQIYICRVYLVIYDITTE
jgi:hypothetical protein